MTSAHHRNTVLCKLTWMPWRVGRLITGHQLAFRSLLPCTTERTTPSSNTHYTAASSKAQAAAQISACFDATTSPTTSTFMALKTSRFSGMTLKLFSTRDQQFLTRVFTTFIRPILEYASCVWTPSSVYASTELEKVQQRFPKRINGLSNLQYEQRLDRLQLDTLAHRRHISDLILAFNNLHGYVSVLPESLGLQLSDAPTRSFGVRLKHYKLASQLLTSSFQCRVPRQWNNLPDRVLKCSSLSSLQSP